MKKKVSMKLDNQCSDCDPNCKVQTDLSLHMVSFKTFFFI